MSTVNGNGDRVTGLDDFEEISIPVPWGHIAGKWWGSQDVQPIIAIHGWQDNAGTFDKLAPLLKNKGHSLLCIDLPGHGFSSHLPPGHKYYIWWDGVHYLRRIVKYYKWTNITILGHSLGGGIAFLYAAIYPKEVEKYIGLDLASPSVRNLKKTCDALGFAIDKFLSYERITPDKIPCYPYNEMLEILIDGQNGSVNREGCKILLKRGMRLAENRDGYLFTRDPRLKMAALGFLSIEQVLELASRITCEVMNIKATPGLKLDHPEHYDMVLDQIEKQAKKVVRHKIEGTHHLHLNEPTLVDNIIHEFLIS
ncbi:unnamed protein product [Ceutorhynchus assimilis]|uniref:AB hydrolase-1 domain-containing protein n=1 Tax=Ceutorhynchus assimilis TaxID=467358 RepID=A0A9N9MIZ6_9CUCU|nr:unnamed protein product [Ceutorhynchus assimilis]